jgi:uncharacterized protein YbaR (Trm112 family)
MTLDETLLELICCPACHGAFAPQVADALTCTSCGLVYPIRKGVPVLLLDEATRPGEARDG